MIPFIMPTTKLIYLAGMIFWNNDIIRRIQLFNYLDLTIWISTILILNSYTTIWKDKNITVTSS